MVAELTFSVQLSALEVEVLKGIISGLDDEKLCKLVKIPIEKLKACFDGLYLAHTLGLVDATRKELVSWKFRG
jgi:hypothetical protein